MLSSVCLKNMDGLDVSVLNLQQRKGQTLEPLACENECEDRILGFTDLVDALL